MAWLGAQLHFEGCEPSPWVGIFSSSDGKPTENRSTLTTEARDCM